MDASVSAVVTFDFQAWTVAQLDRVESALSKWVPADAPAGLGAAMRYAVLDGGKRLRPLLVLAAAEAASAQAPAAVRQRIDEAALRAACAVELIHAYSLVHDDMPCMDNDVLRRGKPTVHVKFGEAQALLAGDALQALAFELLTPVDGCISASVQAALCGLLARAAGHDGMAGGQAIDLASVGVALSEDQLRQMHRLKTGALLRGSVLMGVACDERAEAGAAGVVQALTRYGDAMGLAFQVVDDILDVISDTATLGKTAGKDAAVAKPTYVSLLGLDRAKAYAQTLYDQAMVALDAGCLDHAQTQALRALAGMVVHREK
jgi:farnesyl diphosphate synthase